MGCIAVCAPLIAAGMMAALAQNAPQSAGPLKIAVVDLAPANYVPMGGRQRFLSFAWSYAEQQGYTVLIDSSRNDIGFTPVLWVLESNDITQATKAALATNPGSSSLPPASDSSSQTANAAKIALVDLDRAESSTSEGERLLEALKAKFKLRFDQLQQSGNTGKKGNPTGDEMSGLTGVEKYYRLRQEYAEEREKTFKAFDSKLLESLPKFASQNGFTIALSYDDANPKRIDMDSKRIVWPASGVRSEDIAAEGHDITRDLVEAYNYKLSEHTTESTPPPPAEGGAAAPSSHKVPDPNAHKSGNTQGQTQPSGSTSNSGEKAAGETKRYSQLWKLIEENIGKAIVAVVSVISLVIVSVMALLLLSPRLTLILLEQDIFPINKVAPWFYLTGVGQRRLFEVYRAEIAGNPDVCEASARFVDLPYDSTHPESDEGLSETVLECLRRAGRMEVVGDGGLGKTALCRHIALKTIENPPPSKRRVQPVLIDGLSYSTSLLDLIVGTLKLSRAYVNAAIVESQLSMGYLLIVFDGFSEIREAYREAAENSDIPDFIRHHPDTPFLFTSRNPLPAQVRLALKRPATITLKALDSESEREFLANYLKNSEAEVDTVIRQMGEHLGEIPKIPLMLKLVAEVYDKSGSVPENMPALLSDYADYLLRTDVTGLPKPDGLKFALRHLVRETFIETGGDRGFAKDVGMKLLGDAEKDLANRNIEASPQDILDLLCRARVLSEKMEYCRFFHDSFESYFGARALLAAFHKREYSLLAKCKSNERLKESWDFFVSMLDPVEDLPKLSAALSDGVT